MQTCGSNVLASDASGKGTTSDIVFDGNITIEKKGGRQGLFAGKAWVSRFDDFPEHTSIYISGFGSIALGALTL